MSIRAVTDDELGTIVVVERTQRARKHYRCDGCSVGIYKGDLYRYVWSTLEGSGLTQRFHPECE